jgi:hypothetical protein
MPWHTPGSVGGCKGGLLVKGISARAALISVLLGLAAVAQGQAEDYYVYQTPNGGLVITNKEPPPASKIIKRLNLPENDQAQEPGKPQPNIQPENSPSKNKHTDMTWQEKSH